MMNQTKCCPYCPSPLAACPHLLIVMGRPGEAVGGALAERLVRMWQIVIGHVGDDPVTDPHGIYEQTWNELFQRYAVEGGVTVEGDRWGAIFLPDPTRMQAVIEACISAEEL